MFTRTIKIKTKNKINTEIIFRASFVDDALIKHLTE